MNEVSFVILRRLRRPLIALVIAYAISVWGMVVIPGIDENGLPDHLSFFHALYIVSYTATTIGFGEIPHQFTDLQRAWIIVCIYLCVVAWAYTLGSVFHLSQDPTFRRAISRRRFMIRVQRLQTPFVLIAGYGQSGIMLARMLDRMGYRIVIIEQRHERASRIEIDEFERRPIFWDGDARLPDVLVDAGVTHRHCIAMVAMAGNDETNQSVAIGGTVLNPSLRIIARVHTPMAQANLKSFRNIELINPYETFASNIRLDMGSATKLRAIEWLSGLPGGECPESLNLPKGYWVVCGSGAFSLYVAAALEQAGVSYSLVNIDTAHKTEDDLVRLTSLQEMEGDELHQAGIERAVGLVAGTDSVAVNLALINRARLVNANLYVAIRQTHVVNASLVDASMANLRFVKAEVVAHKARQLLTSPLLIRYLSHLECDDDTLAQRTIELLQTQVGEKVPFMWAFNCFASYAGLRDALSPDIDPPLSIADLLSHPTTPAERLPAFALLLLRNQTEIPLPPEDTVLRSGDRILFAGQRGVADLQRRFQIEPGVLEFVRTGVEVPRSWLFYYFRSAKKRRLRWERLQQRLAAARRASAENAEDPEEADEANDAAFTDEDRRSDGAESSGRNADDR